MHIRHSSVESKTAKIPATQDPGYPRFKGKDRYDSFTYTQSGFSLKPGELWLSKIGDIKIKLHRAIAGELQRLNIRRMPTGKWFVSFLVEVEPDEPLSKTGLSIGVDVGLKSFITLSNGDHIDNPRFFIHEDNYKKAEMIYTQITPVTSGNDQANCVYLRQGSEGRVQS